MEMSGSSEWVTMDEIEDFVKQYYDSKDSMHNLSHIQRILRVAQDLAANQPHDPELLKLGAYFHGMISSQVDEIRRFLRHKGFPQGRIEEALQVAWESLKDRRPQTPEGLFLHDAHLIEGGKTFLITKSLVTGAARGQSLEETISYLEQNILGKFKCYTPRAQKLYEEKEKFAREYLDNLKDNL